MKKRIVFCLLAFFMVFLFCLPLTAGAAPARVFDGAGLFTGEQAAQLEQSIAAFREQTGMDLVVCTTDNTNGKTTQAFADDYYDYNSFGESGAIYLIDMQHRLQTISTKGEMISLLNDRRIEEALDAAAPYLSGEDYAGAAQAFIDKTLGFYQNKNEVAANEKTLSAFLGGPVFIFAALGALAGGLAALSVYRRYRLKVPPYSYPYRQQSKVTLTHKEDRFLHQTVTSYRIPDPPSGSSTHRSSSGSFHGGGSRGF